MNRSRLLTAAVVCGLAACLVAFVVIPSVCLAQPADPPGVDNPIPTDSVDVESWVDLAVWLVQNSAAWFIFIGMAVYLFANLLLGKVTFKGKPIRLGGLSTWLDGLSPTAKFAFIVGVCGLAGAFLGLGDIEGDWTAKSVIIGLVKGLFDGAGVGMAAVAVNDKRRATKIGKNGEG